MTAVLSVSRTGSPAALPLTLAEAKAHLRVDGTADDALIMIYMEAAVDAVEAATRRCLMPQDFEMRLSEFPDASVPIETWHAPVIEVLSVETVAADGTTTTLDADTYQVVAPAGPYAMPATIRVAAGAAWPSVDSDVHGPVVVTYRAGYVQVPAALRAAVLLLLGDSFANREAASVAKIQEQPRVRDILGAFALMSV